MAESNLSKDQERLAKLWDAYEVQEKELELAMKNITNLENKITEMDRVNGVLKKAVEDRDKEIRVLELKVISLEEENSKFQPQIEELQRTLNEEKERYSKLFAISEELEEDLTKTKSEIEIKDKWFNRNVGMLENIRESIVDRNVKLTELDSNEIKKIEEEKEMDPESTDKPPEQDKEEEEKITFKTVELEKEKTEDIKSEIDQGFKPEPNNEEIKPSKDEIIAEFSKIPDVDTTIANTFYNSGYTNIEKLRSATTEELANIDGISPTLARKIRTSLFENQ